MNVDAALAEGLSTAISRRGWSDREVARRMTEAGHKMAHTAVILARQGKRRVTAEEWLTFALVLSVAPLALIGAGEPVEVGGTDLTREKFAAWVSGVRPLPDVIDPAVFYASAVAVRAPAGDHFAGVLRALADQFDTAAHASERRRLLYDVTEVTLSQMRADEARERVASRRSGLVRNSRATPKKGEQR